MKKIFRKTVRFLIDLSLVIIMMMSAQRAMNLPFSWAGIGYAVLFGIALGIFTEIKINAAYKQGVQHEKEERRIKKELYEIINAGEEDEFSITVPKFLINKYFLYFKTKKIFFAQNFEYYYMITELNKIDDGLEVIFSKPNNNKNENTVEVRAKDGSYQSIIKE